jgi:glutamyl-tRNA reductase
MRILCLGLNHTNTPVSLREKLAFSEDAVRVALTRLSCGQMESFIAEMVILSTCNRIEIYAASSKSVFTELEAFCRMFVVCQ